MTLKLISREGTAPVFKDGKWGKWQDVQRLFEEIELAVEDSPLIRQEVHRRFGHRAPNTVHDVCGMAHEEPLTTGVLLAETVSELMEVATIRNTVLENLSLEDVSSILLDEMHSEQGKDVFTKAFKRIPRGERAAFFSELAEHVPDVKVTQK